MAEKKSDPREVYCLTDEERAAVRRGLEEVLEGKFASDIEVKAVFDRYRLK
jgi:hypothetical protein